VVRQLSIKDENSHSWTVRIILLLRKYQLPTAYDLLNSPPTKYQWKKQLKSRIHQYWTKSLYESVRDMSTLRIFSTSIPYYKITQIINACSYCRHRMAIRSISTVKVNQLKHDILMHTVLYTSDLRSIWADVHIGLCRHQAC